MNPFKGNFRRNGSGEFCEKQRSFGKKKKRVKIGGEKTGKSTALGIPGGTIRGKRTGKARSY